MPVITTPTDAPVVTPPQPGDDQGRLQLQRRAGETVQQHLQRALVRVVVLAAADTAAVYVARMVARWLLRDAGLVPGSARGMVDRIFPLGLLEGWQFGVALFISLVVFGCYGAGDRRRSAARIFGAAALGTALTLWAQIWDRGLAVVLVQYLALTVGFALPLLIMRLAVDWATARVFPRRQAVTSRVILIADPRERQQLLASDMLRGASELRVVGWVDPGVVRAADAQGGLADVPRLLAALGAESVLVADSVNAETFATVADYAMAAGCELLFAPRGLDLPGARPRVVWRRGHPLLQLTAPGMLGWQRALKRLMDLSGAALGLAVASVPMLVIALAVKLDSRGPVFFRQERVGQGGRRFRIFKFRTMVEDAEVRRQELEGQSVYGDGRLFKLRDDPRVTRLGQFLRLWSLDEIPQLLNVLLGHMALVGPRPPLPSEVALYEERHFARFEVRPGITGPWQVNGRNLITDFEQVVALEAAYIREWSLWDDIVLLFRTVPAVLNRRGAY